MSRRRRPAPPVHTPPRPPAPSPGGRRGWPAAGLVLLVLGGVGGLWWWAARTPVGGPTSGDRPNLLLVTIDTLRADHLGCYGYTGAETPVLDSLAARGVRFETAIAQAPITGPSHASILTGLTPLRHGVRNNGGFVLPKSVPTLAETLLAAGYRTAAFVSGFPLDKRFGYDRGFQAYDDRFPHGHDPRRAPYVERPADQTSDVARRWLGGQAGAGPWFMWIHYYDPHSPYEPPGPYAQRFAAHPYDGEIAFVDAQLGGVLGEIDRLGAAGRTIVLVTADHGESLGEHGEDTHGMFLYDSTLSVPWIIAGPGVPRGRTTSVVGRLIDVAPTLLDYAGRALPKAVEGRSMRPAVDGRPMADEAAYSESLFANLHLHWAPLHSWRTASWKRIDAPRPELFDLRRDRREVHDLAAGEPQRVAELRRPLRAALRTPTPDATSSVSGEAAERLRALGYIGGGQASSVEEGARLRDPKDALPLVRHLERGMELARIDPATSVRELSSVLEEAPEAALPRRYRAVALAASGRHEEAIADMRLLERAGTLTTEDLIVLGDSLRAAGRTTEALDAFQKATALQPENPLPLLARANTLLAAGRTDEAAETYTRVLGVAPEHSEALRGLGDVALVRGDVQAAGGFYARLLAAAPHDAGAMVKLGVVRMRAGQRDEALSLFGKAIGLDPANVEALLYMAGAMVAERRPAEAVPYFERAVAAGGKSTMLFNGLGMTKMGLGDAAGAARAFRQSLALDPRQPEVADALARVSGRR